MPTGKVKVTVTIRTENEMDDLTSVERWDIISSVAVATRAAIEQYLTPAYHRKAIEQVTRIVNTPARAKVNSRQIEFIDSRS